MVDGPSWRGPRTSPASAARLCLSPVTRGFLAASVFNLVVILLLDSSSHRWGSSRSSSSIPQQTDGDPQRGSDPRKMLTLQRSSIIATLGTLTTPPLALSELSSSQLSAQQLPGEVWARGTRGANEGLARDVRALMSKEEQKELRQICGRCLYHSLTGYVTALGINGPTFVATGEHAAPILGWAHKCMCMVWIGACTFSVHGLHFDFVVQLFDTCANSVAHAHAQACQNYTDWNVT